MRTPVLARLAAPSLALFPLLAHADNSTPVQIQIAYAGIRALDAEGTPLWFESFNNCFATAIMTSTYQSTPQGFAWNYSFSNLTPMRGTLGARGEIKLDLLNLQVSSTSDGLVNLTTATCSVTPTFAGSTYSPPSATLTFTLRSAADLSVAGGRLDSPLLPAIDFLRDAGGGPEQLRLQRAPSLIFTPIPAPGALTLALGAGLVVTRRRR